VSDRTVLSVLHLFEVHKKLSCASLLSTWSSSGDTGSPDALGAVLSLDAAKVFHTCLNFPRGLKFDLDHEYHDKTGFREELYDPLFLNLIFARVISGNHPTSALSWVQFFRTNMVCVVIRSLSSKDDAFRELALYNLSGVWKLLEVRPVSPLLRYMLTTFISSQRTCKRNPTLSISFAYCAIIYLRPQTGTIPRDFLHMRL
jgi:nucleolar pre-ribosomal-associated protein 1